MSKSQKSSPVTNGNERWWGTPNGWLRHSPLLVRLGISAGFVFLWGFLGRFEGAGLATAFVVLFALIAIAWAGFAAFGASRGFLRDGDSKRWLRATSWLVALPLLVPFGFFGNETALVVAPYSAEEIAQFAEAEAAALAEIAAIEAEEREKVEAQEAAEKEKQRLEEARQAEIIRVEAILATLVGTTESEAIEVLESKNLTSVSESKCDSAPEGTVTGGEVSADDPSFVVVYLAKSPAAVPEVVGLSEPVARATVEQACYKTSIKTYYTTKAAGIVVAQDPVPGEILEAEAEVQLMSSARVSGETRTADSVGRWSYLGPRDEEWSFQSPFEIKGRLYIPIQAAFTTNMSWRDPNATGEGFGTATIVDEFDKEVPVKVLYGKQNVPSGETQNFTAVIPLTDLGDQTPTKVSLYLWVEVGGTPKNVTANFTMTW